MASSPGLALFLIFLPSLYLTELLPDPHYEELMREEQSLGLEDGAVAEARASGCHLKETFRGNWFQSGIIHSITVTKDAISTKGHCVEKDGEKYLLYNKRDNCYKCLVFSEKHLNVLQYKETFCRPDKVSLQKLCASISGDANLYTMFRLEATPVDCPFKGHFTVSYRSLGGNCAYPQSTMNSCTKNSKLLFNYQACPDIPGTESSAEELQCLASWKEGSSRYFLGLVSYTYHASYEERFRCFVYERSKHHTHHNSSSSPHSDQIYKVAMSGDATCNGLSAMEGARTMTLKKIPALRSCGFPSWLSSSSSHSHWHTLDQRATYSFHQGSLRVSNSSLSGTGPFFITATCHSLTGNDNILILHTTINCKTGYVCTALYQRDDSIMEIQFGELSRGAEDACQPSHFNATREPYITLIKSSSSPLPRIQCPNVGHFRVVGGTWHGQRVEGRNDCKNKKEGKGPNENPVISIGCSSPHSMRLFKPSTNYQQQEKEENCDTPNPVTDEENYECLSWWVDGPSTFVVTDKSKSTSQRSQRQCFAFTEYSANTLPDSQPTQLDLVVHPDSCKRYFNKDALKDDEERDFALHLHRIGHCSEFNGATTSVNLRSSFLVILILVHGVIGWDSI